MKDIHVLHFVKQMSWVVLSAGHSDGAAAAAASQQEGPEFESPSWLGRGLSVRSLRVLLVSAWVLSGFSSFLPQSKDMHDRLIGNPKLPVGVNVNMTGCLSLCVSPAMNCTLSRAYPASRPMSAGIG